MGLCNYVSLLSLAGNSGHVSLFAPSKGGETAGSVARNSGSGWYRGAETAGSVASSSCGSSSSCSCGSFSAIA